MAWSREPRSWNKQMLLVTENWPFTAAALIMVLIGLIEALSLLVGLGFSELLQQALPTDWEGSDSVFANVLGWLHVGRVPFLALLVLFLASFACVGFVSNLLAQRWLSVWLPPLLSVPMASVISLPVVRVLGMWPARLIKQDETYAVSFDSLVGRVATVVYGTARQGYPAQARVQNEHGQNIYVMVEPDAAEVTFERGERVLLRKRLDGSRFVADVNPWPDLI